MQTALPMLVLFAGLRASHNLSSLLATFSRWLKIHIATRRNVKSIKLDKKLGCWISFVIFVSSLEMLHARGGPAEGRPWPLPY